MSRPLGEKRPEVGCDGPRQSLGNADPAGPADLPICELRIPDHLVDAHADWSWSLAWDYVPGSKTWRLDRGDGQVRYLKVGYRASVPTISDECTRMRWARLYLPVPDVVDCGATNEIDWMLTAALPGMDATAAELRLDPAGLVASLARGLRQFHKAPTEECPFDSTNETAIKVVRRRIEAGQVNPETHFHPEHSHFTPESALSDLERLQPTSEDLVVCHGDYCLPNVLIENGEVTGFLDLGELGVADRWRDLAVATWSVTWNVGPGWERHFLKAYGEVPDPRRMAFYRLLYDLT